MLLLKRYALSAYNLFDISVSDADNINDRAIITTIFCKLLIIRLNFVHGSTLDAYITSYNVSGANSCTHAKAARNRVAAG